MIHLGNQHIVYSSYCSCIIYLLLYLESLCQLHTLYACASPNETAGLTWVVREDWHAKKLPCCVSARIFLSFNTRMWDKYKGQQPLYSVALSRCSPDPYWIKDTFLGTYRTASGCCYYTEAHVTILENCFMRRGIWKEIRIVYECVVEWFNNIDMNIVTAVYETLFSDTLMFKHEKESNLCIS
jgi:hypothetical protein